MAEYQIDANLTSTNSIEAEAERRILQAYIELCNAEDKLESINDNIMNALPEDWDPCSIPEVIEKLQQSAADIIDLSTSLINAMTKCLSDEIPTDISIKIAKGLEKYTAMGIILKKFELLKLKLKRIQLTIEKFILKLNKKMLMGMLSNKGNTNPAISSATTTTLTATAKTCIIIINVLSALLTIINNLFIMNVNGGACCFFKTPKSLKKTDVAITNANISLTNLFSEPIEQALTKAEGTLAKTNANIKKGIIAISATNGAATAMTQNISAPDITSFSKFDTNTIRTAINALLQLVLDAEPLPKYEKLSMTNIRFMVFLLTGFEPSAKMSFGIPGFP